MERGRVTPAVGPSARTRRRWAVGQGCARPAPGARSGGAAALALAALTLASCFQYSPHDLPDEQGLHQRALAELARRPTALPFRFAVVGDVQQVFREAEDAIADLRRRDDLAFVVQVGDFTHMGLAFEYEAMARIFARLHVPWFVVVGNHDLVANGRAIYERMFGPTHLAFTHGGIQFLLLDTNGLESSFAPHVPDLVWVRAQLEEGAAERARGGDSGEVDAELHAPAPVPPRVVVFSHVAAEDPEFNPELRQPFVELLDVAGAVSFHGHAHRYREWEDAGVRHYGADFVKHRNYLLVTVTEGGLDVERVFY